MSTRKSARQILFLIDTNAIGGTERYLFDLATSLTAHNQVSLVCPNFPQLDRWVGKMIAANIRVHRARIGHIFDFKSFLAFFRLMKRAEIAHFVQPCPANNRLGIVCAFIARVPIRISTIQLVTAPTSEVAIRNWYTKNSIRAVSKCLHQIIAVSRDNKRQLINIYDLQPSQITVIHNSIDPKPFIQFVSESSLPQIPRAKLIVGLIGRLHRQKGHQHLIHVAPRIIREIPNVHFLFVGDGELKIEIKELISSRNLDKYFTLLGNRKVKKILPVIDVVVLPSLFEGFPFVILEAMAAAKPVVASDVGGNREAIKEGITGFLFCPENIAKLSELVVYLLKNRLLASKMGQMGRERVNEKFNLSNAVTSYQKLLSKFD